MIHTIRKIFILDKNVLCVLHNLFNAFCFGPLVITRVMEILRCKLSTSLRISKAYKIHSLELVSLFAGF